MPLWCQDKLENILSIKLDLTYFWDNFNLIATLLFAEDFRSVSCAFDTLYACGYDTDAKTVANTTWQRIESKTRKGYTSGEVMIILGHTYTKCPYQIVHYNILCVLSNIVKVTALSSLGWWWWWCQCLPPRAPVDDVNVAMAQWNCHSHGNSSNVFNVSI